MRGARRYSAEILLAPGDRIILDDDSVSNLEARANCLVPATLYSRLLAAARRRLIVRWLVRKNDPREEGAATQPSPPRCPQPGIIRGHVLGEILRRPATSAAARRP